jgi:hypothetical protein
VFVQPPPKSFGPFAVNCLWGLHAVGRERRVTIFGAAWAGDTDVTEICISLDGGASWIQGDFVDPITRRDLLLTSLLAALPLGARSAAATPLNPAQTIVKLPDALQWETQPSFPQGSTTFVP